MHRVADISDNTTRDTTAHLAWWSWTLGGAVLVAVIAAALHFSEERAFVRVAHDAKPWWLVVAVVLQAGTYLAQGTIWRLAARASGCALSRPEQDGHGAVRHRKRQVAQHDPLVECQRPARTQRTGEPLSRGRRDQSRQRVPRV
jgi:hypothetical protein